MSSPTEHGARRPPSPWSGSRHETRHSWQLDQVRDLAEAANALRRLAAELVAAHAAGWLLLEPMRSGHVLAARPSRRSRARALTTSVPGGAGVAPTFGWRLRIIDEPPVPGDEVLDLSAAPRTAVITSSHGCLRRVSGPQLAPELLANVARQLAAGEVDGKVWGIAPARVGPSADLVAGSSALRVHAVHDGALVCTVEALAFEHAADGAASLLDAAAAYQRVAWAAEAMAAAGGRLVGVEDGHLRIICGRR